jgi:hypothetical protein
MRIIYENQDKSIAVLTPTQEALSFATIHQIAEKDVPYNLPYWIVEDNAIPSDRTNREAWQLDRTQVEPDGLGGESNEFDAELLGKFKQRAIV